MATIKIKDGDMFKVTKQKLVLHICKTPNFGISYFCTTTKRVPNGGQKCRKITAKRLTELVNDKTLTKIS